MIMAFDPEILFNDGIYDVFEVTLPEGSLLNPKFPAPLSNRLNVHTRLFDCHQRRARPEGARPLDGGGLRDEPVLRLLGLRRATASTSSSSSCSSAASRPATRARRARRPLVVAALPHDPVRVRGELLPGADRELRAGARLRRRRAPPRRHRDREDLRVHSARARSPSTTTGRTIPPWGINGGRHGGCSTKTLIRAVRRGRRAAVQDRPGPGRAPATRCVFRTAGAGGWGDPLERDPELVLRDVRRDLVSPEAALRDYGVVDRRRRVDEAATGVRACAPPRAARAGTALRLRPRPDRRTPHDREPASSTGGAGAIVALGAHDGLTARIAERAGIEALYHGGYALAAHHFGLARRRPRRPRGGRRERPPHARRDRACRSSSTPTPGTGPRPGVCADDARARGRRRQCRADRGSGLAQALRPHGGQGRDPGRGDGDQGRGPPSAARRSDETLDHRPLRRAAGDRARGHDRALQRLRRGGRRPRLRRCAADRRGVHGDRGERCSAPCVANMSETGRSPADPDRGAGDDGLQARHLPEHPDLGVREGLRGALPARSSATGRPRRSRIASRASTTSTPCSASPSGSRGEQVPPGRRL